MFAIIVGATVIFIVGSIISFVAGLIEMTLGFLFLLGICFFVGKLFV